MKITIEVDTDVQHVQISEAGTVIIQQRMNTTAWNPANVPPGYDLPPCTPSCTCAICDVGD